VKKSIIPLLRKFEGKANKTYIENATNHQLHARFIVPCDDDDDDDGGGGGVE
jgi:hypothetical protein